MRGRLAKWLPVLAAAALYASIAIAWTWPLARESHLYAGVPPELDDIYDTFSRNDQLLSIWGAAANARALLDLDFRRLIDNGTCWPLSNAATLGEHMIELGVLALPGYAFTGDPLIAYNSACLLLVVIAGVGMFALVRSWTGSTGAALVAGFLFAFQPTRISNLMHPAVVGTHWIPLVLLMFERVLATGTLGSAVLLWIVTVLACLTGSYPMLALLVFGAPYGLIRFIQLRTRITRSGALALAVAVVGVAAVILPLLAAYSAAGETWYSLRPRYAVYMNFEELLPGRYTGIGALAPSIAALALFFRRRRVGEPVTALVVAGATCALLSCQGPLWPGGPPLQPLYETLAQRVSLLLVLRAPVMIRVGVYVAVAALAGIGLARALAARGKAVRVAICTVVIAALTAETFVDRFAVAVYDNAQEFVLRPLRPDDATLAAYAAFDERGLDGPIIDLPYDTTWGQFAAMPNFILFAAYHGRATAACYNSFLPHNYDNAGRLSERFIATGDPRELVAAGFRNVVWHSWNIAPLPQRLLDADGVEVLRSNGTASALRLDATVPTQGDRRTIEPVRVYQKARLSAGLYGPRLYLTVRNESDVVWALPRPIAATLATLTWYPADVPTAAPYETSAPLLLPLSLAGDATDSIPVPVVPLPVAGHYRVALDVPSLHWHLLSDEIVTID